MVIWSVRQIFIYCYRLNYQINSNSVDILALIQFQKRFYMPEILMI